MRHSIFLALTAGLAAAASAPLAAQTAGTESDVAFAEAIWLRMEARGLTGPDAVLALPYRGTEPHGAMLETFFLDAEVEGETGLLVVKRNYGPAGVAADAVLSDPEAHLAAVTVMFRRSGYDPEHGNWFYAKYLPDGALDTNADGMALAGAPARGMVGRDRTAGCVACHAEAPGGDYLYTTDAVAGTD
jgi:hypothetical protein